MKRMFVIVLTLLVLFGCTAPQQARTGPAPIIPAESQESKTPNTQSSVEDATATGREASPFKGTLLAGTTTPYLDFSQEDYEAALKSKAYVVLYFYANWCPICRAEQPDTFAAFNELQRNDMAGFRVNFKDSDTDSAEVALAQQFGVTYQHTKVVLKNGQRILKSPESWTKQDYLDQLGSI